MTKHNEYDFTQFTGKFDSSMTPDGDFADRMKQMLERETGNAKQQRKATVIASPSRKGNEVPAPGRRTHPLTIAASILVVVAVVFSSIWVLSGTQLQGEYASAPSGIATLPADVATTPGSDIRLNSTLVLPYNFNSWSTVYTLDVINGVAYTSHGGPSTTGTEDTHTEYFAAWDVETGEKLWEIEGYSLWNLELSDGVLVAFRSNIPPPEQRREGTEWWPTTSLIALDADSGEVIWEGTPDNSVRSRMWEYQFVVIDDMVVTVDSEGEMVSRDLHTGSEQWSATVDMGKGWETEFQTNESEAHTPITLYAIAITAWNGQVAIANGDGQVQLINAATGDVTASHDIGGESPAGVLRLNPLPQGLLLTHGEGGYHLTAFDPASGDAFWDRGFEGDIRVDVADNGMIAVTSHIWESGNFLMRLIGRGGHSTYQMTWIDGVTGLDVLTTDRGRIDNPVFSISNGEYTCSRLDEFVCYDRAGTRHVIADGPWAQAFFDNDALYFDRDDGLYRVDLP